MDGTGASTNRDQSTRSRDHLANERTYLAWLRTAANVMIVGLALAKFGDRGSATVWTLAAGGVLVATGAGGVVYGTSRYIRVSHELESGRSETVGQVRGPVLAAAVLLVSILFSLAVLMIGGRSG